MDRDFGTRVVHRELDVDRENPAVEIVQTVAELEGKHEDDLASFWSCMDDVLDEIFSTPPSPEARIQTSFDYEGFRITVDQNGSATFVRAE